MIPILYESTETSFTSNGIGRLSDAVSCVVTEERNGPYELEMEYPVTGIHYDDIQLFRFIYAVPADDASGQPFEIYEISRPLNGVVTVRAWHISYRLNQITVEPFTAASCSAALVGLKSHSINTNPFSFTTDKSVSATFTVETPSSLRGLLGGQSGSILEVYGKGEYEFDGYTVYFRTNRGSNRGVTIRFGKNLTDLTADTGMVTVYTGIVPYYYQDGTLVMLSEQALWSTHRSDYPYDLLKPVDLTSMWSESAPTEAQLRTAAQSYLDSNEGWELNTNLTVSFVALADTEEYKDISALQQVSLCDTVTIIHEGLGVSATAKVIRTEYDTLLERYNEIELGDSRTSLGEAITAGIPDEISEAVRNLPSMSVMEEAIAAGTALISGNDGGYIKIKTNANGQPQQILIMNTNSESTATKIWRWNSAGIGYSSDGGTTYKQAWTINGQFYTDWVTAGSINAALVNTGTITSADGKVQIVLSETGNTGQLIITSGNLQLDAAGNASITGEIVANSGRIGGSSGLVVDSGKLYYGKSSMTSGSSGLYIGTDGVAIGRYKGDGNSYLTSLVVPAAGSQAYDSNFPDADGSVIIGKLYFRKYPPDTGYSSYGMYADSEGRIWTPGAISVNTLNLPADTATNYLGGTTVINTLGACWNDAQFDRDVNIDGDLTVQGAYPSDRNRKDEIKSLDIEESRRFIMGLNPVQFKWSNIEKNKHMDKQGVHHGMIAQEVDALNPKWAVVNKRTEYMSLEYTEMISDLVKVVQDQQKRIEALEAALGEQ